MALSTRPQYKQLLQNGLLNSTRRDFVPVVKLHLSGMDCAWLLTELGLDDPKMAYGLQDLATHHPDMGTIDLANLQTLTLPLNIALEQDEGFIGLYPIRSMPALPMNAGLLRKTRTFCASISSTDQARTLSHLTNILLVPVCQLVSLFSSGRDGWGPRLPGLWS